MSAALAFLSVDHVVAIHRRMIAEFGGDDGVRDSGLLESAVMMPRASFGGHYLHKGVPTMAAAYLFHLCKNHAFVDGNKRTAFAAALLFLDLNGYRLYATNHACEHWVMSVAAGSVTKDQLARLFREHVRRDS